MLYFLRNRRLELTFIFHSVLYLRKDPYENSDAVFEVKNSLVVDLGELKIGSFYSLFEQWYIPIFYTQLPVQFNSFPE